jgi:hypothetical protein
MYGSKSAGGITLISETIVLRRTNARSIKRETTGFSEDVRPHGCHGRLGVFVKRLLGTAVKPCQKRPRLLAHRVSSSSKKKEATCKRWGSRNSWMLPPPLMCTMTKLLHYNIFIKRFTNHCFFYFTYK